MIKVTAIVIEEEFTETFTERLKFYLESGYKLRNSTVIVRPIHDHLGNITGTNIVYHALVIHGEI